MRFFFLFLCCLLPAMSMAAEAVAPIVLIYETGGKKTDNSFVDMARQGAERAKQDLGLDYQEHVISKNETREEVFRRYAKAKAELIIALGFQNVPTVISLADEYPLTSFTVIDGMVPPNFSNVQSIVFRDNEGAFLVGVIAAMHSKSNKIGFIGGMDVPVIRDFAYGYRQGAEYINKEIQVLTDMIGTTNDAWSNPKKAAQLTQKQIAQKADVIFAAAGGSSIGMLERVAQNQNVHSIGVDTNQNNLYPNSVLTSLVKRVDKAVYDAMKQRSDNSWKPGVKYFGIKEGALDYAVDQHNRDVISAESIDKAERMKDYIMRGIVKVYNYRPSTHQQPLPHQ